MILRPLAQTKLLMMPLDSYVMVMHPLVLISNKLEVN